MTIGKGPDTTGIGRIYGPLEASELNGFFLARKKGVVRMIRMNGPFRTTGKHGLQFCLDGYLAVDGQGQPYPVPAGEYDRTWEKVKEDSK